MDMRAMLAKQTNGFLIELFSPRKEKETEKEKC